MATTSPFGNIYLELVNRLKTEVPELRYIDQDFGQLENYTTMPPVSFPCVLIELGEFDFEDFAGKNTQQGQGMVLIRFATEAWSQSNNLATQQIRETALAYYDIEQKIHLALHGWRATGFSKLLRRKAVKEQRDDTNLRVRILAYTTSFEDETTMPVMTTIPRPALTIGEEKP